MTYMSLSQRIQLEQGKSKPSEVIELHLDHAKATDIVGLTSDYSSLELLSLSTVGLEKLDGLPELHSLKMLDLSSNNLTGGLENLLRCPNLEQLNLSANKIESLDLLNPLAKLSSLKKLDLFDCGVASAENYRKKVFALIPNLVYLDGLDQNDNEEPSDQVTNGEEDEVDENGAGDEDEDDDSEDEEEEYGIEALQRSGDLEDDDEEDYAPGEDEENELDDYDDIDDDEDDVDEEDDGANLSGAGVTEPRRTVGKRRLEAAEEADDAPVAKHKATSEGENDETAVNNGSTADK